jgi:hypothetical protein
MSHKRGGHGGHGGGHGGGGGLPFALALLILWALLAPIAALTRQRHGETALDRFQRWRKRRWARRYYRQHPEELKKLLPCVQRYVRGEED